MNAAEIKTCGLIEATLRGNRAFRKVDERLYVIKQGSTYVMINVLPWGQERALVRCVSQLVRGVRMEEALGLELLRLNLVMRFGAFAYDEQEHIVVFLHSILGGETLDAAELLATIRAVALVADEWDDRIIQHYGGQRMQDLLEEAAMQRLIAGTPEEHRWNE